MPTDSSRDEFIERIRSKLGDRYEISRELFGGGMSRVFVAREVALDRQVVIKFLPPEIAAEANRDRFRREIQVAARLSHPHIAPLFAAAEEGELLYFTMPYIAGESLRQSLDAGRRFSVGETMEILLDVADALAYAHRAGIVHRDIKPANILREGDHAVITDFGVAKALSHAMGHGSGPRTATTSGLAFGTPAYMAPEQIAGDSAADHRVDIYAFGLLGYELLTGQAPFRSTSPQAVMAAQLTQAPPPILQARADVPPVLAALLTRCLEKDATRRPPTAESVLEVLRAVNAASGGNSFSGSYARQRNTNVALIGGGLAVIAAAVWFVATKTTLLASPPPPPPPMVAAAPEVDSAVLRAKEAAARAESALAKFKSSDSSRRAGERATKQDQRLLGLLRDSITNAIQRQTADSMAKARELELANAQRIADSVKNARRTTLNIPQLNMRNGAANAITPESFLARRSNMGPPRRIGVSIFSGLRNPAVVIAATAVRDSLNARLKGAGRYILVPTDSVTQALLQSKDIDSLRTWLKSEMWVTINATGDVGADSLRWNLTLRDFSAHSTYSQMTTTSQRIPVTTAADATTVTKLVDGATKLLDTMDKAPRRQP